MEGYSLGQMAVAVEAVGLLYALVHLVDPDTTACPGTLREIIQAVVLSVQVEIDKFPLRRIAHAQIQRHLRGDPVQQIGRVKGVGKQAELFAGGHAQNTLLLHTVYIVGPLAHVPGTVSPSGDRALTRTVGRAVRQIDHELPLLTDLLVGVGIHCRHAPALRVQIHGRRAGTGKNIQNIGVYFPVLSLQIHCKSGAVFKSGHLVSRRISMRLCPRRTGLLPFPAFGRVSTFRPRPQPGPVQILPFFQPSHRH